MKPQKELSPELTRAIEQVRQSTDFREGRTEHETFTLAGLKVQADHPEAFQAHNAADQLMLSLLNIKIN